MSDTEIPDPYDDEFINLLMNAMTAPMTERDQFIASLGYTCGYVPPERRDELNARFPILDKDWY